VRLPISVIIPARDAEATLAQTIRSVQAQTVCPSRVLVIDDGSSDRTREVALAYAPSVEIIDGPERGVAAARNLGLRALDTQYVALLDADDRWEPWFLAEVAAVLESHPTAAAVFISACVVDDAGRPVGSHPLPDAALTLRDLALGRVVPTTSATVVHRETVLGLGGFFEDLERPAAEDLDLWFRLAEQGRCVSSARVSAVYVMHEERDRSRASAELSMLERDRERVVRRLSERGADPLLARRASAIMRARTARYWLLTGRAADARRIARLSIRAAPTVEGALTLAAACAPASLRERARSVRRQHRTRHVT
jgi:glycosyltransferase involved in cell wall biosynthesis